MQSTGGRPECETHVLAFLCAGDTCATGACAAGAKLACNDGKPCTTDACDAVLGCVYLPLDLTCSDGNACTVGDLCSGGECLPGTNTMCDDGNACTLDTCDLAAGCTFSPNTKPCDDGVSCTTGDTCKLGTCVAGTVQCDDGNPCTIDLCTATGCSHGPASNGTACVVMGASCQAGRCIHPKWDMVYIPAGSAWIGCDEDADNSCAANEGPAHLATTGAYWIGRHEVTVAQYVECTKIFGWCQPPKVAWDGTPEHAAFNWKAPGRDGHPMNGADWVNADKFCLFQHDYADVTASLPSEAQWERAARGGCETVTGACQSAPLNTWGSAAKPPQAAENLADLAWLLAKMPGPAMAGYADGAVTTAVVGSYTPNVYGLFDIGGNLAEWTADCWHETYSGAPADGSPWSGCTYADAHAVRGPSHASGAEVHVTLRQKGDPANPAQTVGFRCVRPAVPCDDGEPCTKDTQNLDGSCSHAPVKPLKSGQTVVCNDWNACTSGSICNGSACQPGVVPSCDDNDACTVDFCDPIRGCVHASMAAACDDGNACTDDICDPKKGCQNLANNLPCSDGNACTSGDTCASGACVPGGPTNCDDGNACTIDTCKATGCVHDAKAVVLGTPCETSGTCIGGKCVAWKDEMVQVPGGAFVRGCVPGVHPNCGSPGNSASTIDVAVNTFWIDKNEVTVSAFAACVQAGACQSPLAWNPDYTKLEFQCMWNQPTGPGPLPTPVNCVTLKQSQDYCTWKKRRLPTATEWEMAARGGCALYPGQDCGKALPAFPWGNTAGDCNFAWIHESKPFTGCWMSIPQPVAQKIKAGGPYGVFDLIGNVRERVQDCSHGLPVTAGPTDGGAWVTDCDTGFSARMAMGGDYTVTSTPPVFLSTSVGDSEAVPTVGFRCAKSAEK